MSYTLLKLIHIGAFLFWLGPALGAWFVLKYSQKQTGETSATTSLIYRVFFFTIWLEHIALLVLLTTGVMMAIQYSMFEMVWFQQKLLVIMYLIIPLEIIDIWLGNWKVKKLIEQRNGRRTLSDGEHRLIGFYHKEFTYTSLALIPVSVALIMWLAISKSPIW